MSKIITNRSGSTRTWCGQELEDDASYSISISELPRWQSDSAVLADITDGDLVVSDGIVEYDPAAGLLYLLNTPGPTQLKPFATADGFRARFVGFSGTAAADQTTNIDYTLTAERWINGVSLLVSGATAGDSLKFQVVHPQAGVLDTFGDSWYVNPEQLRQDPVVLSYPAKLLSGLILRVGYTNTGESAVWVAVNLHLHMKT